MLPIWNPMLPIHSSNNTQSFKSYIMFLFCLKCFPLLKSKSNLNKVPTYAFMNKASISLTFSHFTLPLCISAALVWYFSSTPIYSDLIGQLNSPPQNIMWLALSLIQILSNIYLLWEASFDHSTSSKHSQTLSYFFLFHRVVSLQKYFYYLNSFILPCLLDCNIKNAWSFLLLNKNLEQFIYNLQKLEQCVYKYLLHEDLWICVEQINKQTAHIQWKAGCEF